ncbi:hypothetical protein B0T18DRAFT_392979 [Schizothecium vesticola]|uniref:Uncharacterized protein n=1 Tax=Schizothecium vesticola TaxID=314040 RepID=A0AA40BTG0_9PEZI|nr:hypothetical protein B0T18DRAFT_392979 [Schizothecium vesticola]
MSKASHLRLASGTTLDQTAPSASPNPALFLPWDAVGSHSPVDKRRDVVPPEPPPGYLHAFGGKGCYGDAGWQGGSLEEGAYCFRVEDKGSVHWTQSNPAW